MTKTTKTKFRCPFTHTVLNIPCGLSRCDLWASLQKNHCLLEAYQQHKSNVSLKHVIEMIGMKSTTFHELVESGHDQLRWMCVDPDLIPLYSFVPNSGRCVVCNKKLAIKWNDWGWCSIQCFEWLPPQALTAQVKWGQLMKDLFNSWKRLSVSTISKILEADEGIVYWLLWQHVGVYWEPHSNRWVKTEAPLVPHPTLPKPKKLLRRIAKAESWRTGV